MKHASKTHPNDDSPARGKRRRRPTFLWFQELHQAEVCEKFLEKSLWAGKFEIVCCGLSCVVCVFFGGSNFFLGCICFVSALVGPFWVLYTVSQVLGLLKGILWVFFLRKLKPKQIPRSA